MAPHRAQAKGRVIHRCHEGHRGSRLSARLATGGVAPDDGSTVGLLAGVIRFSDEAEAIRLAHDSEFGLASYSCARDISRVWRVGEALEAGRLGINTGLISTKVAPFGGVKQSGPGRKEPRHGLDDYIEIKYLCMGISRAII